MPFNTHNFIFIFLPFFLLSYYLADVKAKKIILLLYSILFYVIGNYKRLESIFILVFLTFMNYVFLLFIVKAKRDIVKKIALIIAVSMNIIVLCLFKLQLFTNFIPLGLSFYTFHFISIIVDAYKNKHLSYKLIDYLNYILFFPKLLSGPIMRYDNFISEYSQRQNSENYIVKGLFFFSVGLALKCLLADNIAYIINQINVYGFDSISILTAWVGMYSYTMQLYFDFAGYSLMAIGVAYAIGIKMPDNFNLPFCSKSISEFWRRWHITLGHFFRDYIYIPLGGNFANKRFIRQSLNLIIVWLVTGFWHGFRINFILWAMFICIIIILEKAFFINIYKKHEIIGRIVVCILMPFSFLIFSITNLNDLKIYIHKLFEFSSVVNMRDFQVIIKNYAKIFVIGILFLTKYPKALMEIVCKSKYMMIIASASLVLISMYAMSMMKSDVFKYFAF